MDYDGRIFRLAAAKYWKNSLTQEERNLYREQACKERELLKQKQEELGVVDRTLPTGNRKKTQPKVGTSQASYKHQVLQTSRRHGRRTREFRALRPNNNQNKRLFRSQRAKVPESLRQVIRKRPTHRVEIRSRTMRERRLATKAAIAAKRGQALMKAVESGNVEERCIPPGGSISTSASLSSDEEEHVASRPLQNTQDMPNTSKEAIKNTEIGENSSKKTLPFESVGYTGEFELLSDQENAMTAGHESL